MRGRNRTLGVAAASAVAACALLGCESSPIGFRALRVHDVTPDNPVPSFVVIAIVQNPGEVAVELTDDARLRVRSTNSGGEMSVTAEPIDDGPLRVGPGESAEWLFDLWQLSNLFHQGTFPDLRDEPDAMRFELTLETDAGAVTSDEWAGVTVGADLGAVLRDLRGGTEL